MLATTILGWQQLITYATVQAYVRLADQKDQCDKTGICVTADGQAGYIAHEHSCTINLSPNEPGEKVKGYAEWCSLKHDEWQEKLVELALHQ